MSWLLFAGVDEVPDGKARDKPAKAKHYFRDLAAEIKRDANFRNFMLFRVTGKMGGLITPFLTVVALTVHDVPQTVLGTFIAAGALARMVTNFVFPFIAERIGNKRSLFVWSCERLFPGFWPTM